MLQLFLMFFKIGLFVFGGGYAMISFVEEECVEKRKWLELDEFQSVCAIAESTPGPIAINLATYVGQKRGGFWGAAAATLGVTLPSFIIIYVISLFFDKVLSIALIANAFAGIKVGVAILILRVGINMLKKSKRTLFSWVVMCVAAVCAVLVELLSANFSSIWLIVCGGACGILLFALSDKRGRKQ